MRYVDFKEFVKEHILEFLPEEYKTAEVSITSVQKNNGLILDGLTIKKLDSNIAPNIYLNEFYHDLEEDVTTLEECMEKLSQIRIEYDRSQIDTSKFTIFDAMKDKIFMRVVNRDYNQKLLESIPHRCIDNLAITYAFIAMDNSDGLGSARISNELMKSWETTEDKLYEIALENTPKLFPPSFKAMKDVMREIMGEIDVPEELLIPDSCPNMYILSNDRGINGASSLFYPGMMEKVAKELGSDYVVLPSSIHEVIILAADASMDKEYLVSMVQEVNETQLAPEEVLSATAYYYDRKEGVFYDLDKEDAKDKAVQKNKEYLEKIAKDYYNKANEHPNPEGEKAFLNEIKAKVEEKGYHNTLSELKDMHSVLEKSAREHEVSINNPKMEL